MTVCGACISSAYVCACARHVTCMAVRPMGYDTHHMSATQTGESGARCMYVCTLEFSCNSRQLTEHEPSHANAMLLNWHSIN